MKPFSRMRPGLLPVISLVAIVAWALFAVVTLTGTMIAAQGIDNRVVAINTTYPEIKQNLDSIQLAVETGRIAEQIDAAVKPIGPQFTQIIEAAGGIEANAKLIEDNAASINSSVKSINTRVHSIGVTVGEIDSGLSAVNGDVGSINNSAQGIGRSFEGILGSAGSIQVEVAGINSRGAAVTDLARGIKDDLDKVQNLLVPGIIQNSGAIQGSPLLLGTDGNPLRARLASLSTLTAVDGLPAVEGLPAGVPLSAPSALLPLQGTPDPGPQDTGVVPGSPAPERSGGLLAPLGRLTGLPG